MIKIAIIGSGPAGLMCADRVSQAGYTVHVFEKNPGLGRKILIAGSSGLNIGTQCTEEVLLDQYCGKVSDPNSFPVTQTGGSPEEDQPWDRTQWKALLTQFSLHNWLSFIQGLGLKPFLGSSGRYFIKTGDHSHENVSPMATVPGKGSGLLGLWVERLRNRGVKFYTDTELVDFDITSNQVAIKTAPALPAGSDRYAALVLCLGGGSWVKQPPRWPEMLIRNGLGFTAFRSANAGYQVDWSPGFLKEAEGLPLKNVCLRTEKGIRKGELIVTSYGLEGTPIYTVGTNGPATLDLSPELSFTEISTKLGRTRENLSPIRRVKKLLGLCTAAQALLYHHAPKQAHNDLSELVKCIKEFPLNLRGIQPIEQAISADGGLHMKELNDSFMIRRLTRIFAAGEMLNWSAPTGGFLIQGCVAQGWVAGHGVLKILETKMKNSVAEKPHL